MSRIEFQTKHDVVEIWGGERAVFGVLINEIGWTGLKSDIQYRRNEVLKGLPDYCIFCGEDLDLSQLRTIQLHLFHGFERDTKIYDPALKEWSPPFVRLLNETLRKGSDSVKFVCRVHAQCELNGYIKKENYLWLANIIEKGLKDCVLIDKINGHSKGWNKLIDFLRSSEESVMVMSYTVTDGFPGCHYTNLTQEEYEKLDYGDRWDLSLEELLKDEGKEIKPEDWNDFYFYGDD